MFFLRNTCSPLFSVDITLQNGFLLTFFCRVLFEWCSNGALSDASVYGVYVSVDHQKRYLRIIQVFFLKVFGSEVNPFWELGMYAHP